MKIIIGTTSYYSPNISGAGISTHLLAVYLKSQGHQVHVITPGDKLKNYTEESRLGSIELYRLKSVHNPLREGLFIPVLPASEVKRIIHEIEPDIVHIQDPMPMNIILQKEANSMGVPVIITNHFTVSYILAYINSFLQPIFEPMFLKKIVSFYNQCDAVTCPTDTIHSILHENGVTKDIFTISNGVDLARFKKKLDLSKFHSKFNLPENKKILLYLGRVDKDKTVDVLIKMMIELQKRDDIHLVIAGTGDLIDSIENSIIENNLSKRVTLTGRIDYESDDLVSLYHLADVFVTPSKIESQGMVVLEAMASSLPVIGANAGALPEIIIDNKNGYLFKPDNYIQLTNLITNLVDDKVKIKKMGQESLKIASKHSLIKSQEAFEKLYQSMI